jgi:hypothetical protein
MNTSTKISPSHAGLFGYLFESTNSSDIAETFSFRLSGDFGGEFYAGVIPLHAAITADTKLVFSLPTHSSDVFIALTESNFHETARYLANLEDYEREYERHLAPGDAIVIAQANVPGADEHYALYLLQTASSLDLERVGNATILGDVTYRFFLTIVLSRYEYDFRVKNGNDALLDHFTESGKSLLMFERNNVDP